MTQNPTKARATRYVVRPKPSVSSAADTAKPRIVMAPSRASAIAHVASTMFDVAPATVDDMEQLVAEGIRTEFPGQAAADGAESEG